MTYAEPRLRTERETECDRCGGSGVEDDEECPNCWGLGCTYSHSAPTAADLLADPRVRALVRALRRSEPTSGSLHDEKTEALAPWGV